VRLGNLLQQMDSTWDIDQCRANFAQRARNSAAKLTVSASSLSFMRTKQEHFRSCCQAEALLGPTDLVHMRETALSAANVRCITLSG
jgi:hypothetical protein